jgi:hypothetical protein
MESLKGASIPVGGLASDLPIKARWGEGAMGFGVAEQC